MKRLSVLLRGPLFALLVPGVCVGATRLAHPPLASTTTTARTPITGGLQWHVALTVRGAAVNPKSGLSVRIDGAHLSVGTKSSTIRVGLQTRVISVHPGSKTPAVLQIGPDQFLAVLPDGSTYFAKSLTMAHGFGGTMEVDFQVPDRPKTAEIVWNAGGSLIPPASLGTVRLILS